MKETLTILATFLPLLTIAQTFTTIKQNPITSVKDQNLSGTCWDYATLGFVESEILRTSGRTYDLCEMFVANKDYMDNATHHVRMHGFSQICEGGSADDVFEVIKTYGICPEDAMPAPGSLVGDTLANFTEFMKELRPLVRYYGTGTNHSYPADTTGLAYWVRTEKGWKEAIQSVIDRYIGKCPETFTYDGNTYTPKTFAATLGIDWNNYISLTSFTHHPFYENFVLESPHKWRPRPSFNLPIDRLMTILDDAIMKGYCVAWGGDVSGHYVQRDDGYYYPEGDFNQQTGVAKLPKGTSVTQIYRQAQWDNWQFTYDHVMLIYGIAKGSDGQKYYMVKNSWGTQYGRNGIWYMSEDYIKLYTAYLFLCKDAVKKKMLKP
ncbi:MAG: aminopeptidase [Bacteroidales bacterium]|nr:aminopeptidase [Bacteroidales bacterium]